MSNLSISSGYHGCNLLNMVDPNLPHVLCMLHPAKKPDPDGCRTIVHVECGTYMHPALQAPVKSRTKIVAVHERTTRGIPWAQTQGFSCEGGKITGHVSLTGKNTVTPVPDNESDTSQTRGGQASFAFIN